MSGILNHLPQAERLLSGTITNAGIDAVQTSVILSNPPTKFPTFLEFEPNDISNSEVVRALSASGNTVIIERGVYNAGVGKPHDINKPYKQKIFAKHWDAMLAALESGYLTEDPTNTLTRFSSTRLYIAGGDYTAYYTQGRLLRFNFSDSATAVVGTSTYDGVNNRTVVDLSVGTIPGSVTSVEIAIQPRGATNKYITTAEVQAGGGQYAADAGSTDTYVISLSPALTSYQIGTRLIFKPNTDNTGACSLNVNGLGAIPLKYLKDQDLPDGYLKAGAMVEVVYNGTNFEVVSVNSYPGVGRVVTPVPAGSPLTATLDLATANEFEFTLTANTTLDVINVKNRQKFFVDIIQAASGGPFSITFFAGINWVQGFVPTMSVGAGKRDTFCFKQVAPGAYIGYVVGQNA